MLSFFDDNIVISLRSYTLLDQGGAVDVHLILILVFGDIEILQDFV